MKHDLFPIEELPAGQMRAVKVGGVSILIIHTDDGSLHALRNVCAHQGAKLEHGPLQRAVSSDGLGSYALADDYVVRCPWHGFEYDAASGRALADPDHCRVRAYRVSVEAGRVLLER